MTKPIWLLDVDGVLNACVPEPDPSIWPDWKQTTSYAGGRGWRINYSPTVIAFINGLIEEGLVTVMWLTTWENEANGSLATNLGLPHLPLAGKREYAEDGWWKLPIAQDVISQGQPVIWTDDDIPYDRPAKQYLQGLAAGEGKDKILAIGPRTATGLTPAHLKKIREFVLRHTQDD